MRRIQFETSLGIVRGTISSVIKEYEDFGEKFVVDIDPVCEINLDDLFSWKSVFIYNYQYCKIELIDCTFGYPEYKYKKINDDVQESNIEKESLEIFWEDCVGINVKNYSEKIN